MGYRQFGQYDGYYEDGAAALRFEKRLAPAADAGRMRIRVNSARRTRASALDRLAPRLPPTHGGERPPGARFEFAAVATGVSLIARLGSRPAA